MQGSTKNNLFGNYISFKTLIMLKLYEMFKHKYLKLIGGFLLIVYFKVLFVYTNKYRNYMISH